MLIYRKVLRLKKQGKNIMISALREENLLTGEDGFQDPFVIKLILYENMRVIPDNSSKTFENPTDRTITERPGSKMLQSNISKTR